MRPSATTLSHGNKSRKAVSTGIPADCSERVGDLLLNIPRFGSNECHGNAFQRTNSSGDNSNRNNVLQTIVAVGSEKPSRYVCGLLVRRGAMLENTCSRSIPVFRLSKSRSDVIGIPVKCPPR